MKKHNEQLIRFEVAKNELKSIDLGAIYPLGKIQHEGQLEIEASHDEKTFFKIINDQSFENQTARYLKITSSCDTEVIIYMGLGYYAVKNDEMTEKFVRKHGWSGADGIYSFNLEQKEWYDQKNNKTLLVFGDTFCGQVEGHKRIEPTAMVNNTLAYLSGDKIEFEVARDPQTHAYQSLFEPTKKMIKRGYLAENLVRYLGKDIDLKPFVSAMDFPKDVELVFDFHGQQDFVDVDVVNYFDNPSFGLPHEKRGVKVLDIYISDDNVDYRFVASYKLKEYSIDNPINKLAINQSGRYIKFVIPHDKNFIGSINKDDMSIGLKKVYFNDKDGLLDDVEVASNTEFFVKYVNAWYWLQDGVVINNKFYSYPCLVEEELNGIEGYEFKISGVAGLEMNIVDGKIDYRNAKAREVPFYKLHDDKEYIMPSAIFYNDETKQNGDGYIYFYGYYNERKLFLRHLFVGRIKPEEITDLNNMRYFDGASWVKDMTKAKSLLTHVSCEMSVQPIIEGENKGKYLAVFQYDTNGPKVAYAIGETPYGPFGEPRIIYVTPELGMFGTTTTYTYNAKAHLHLSSPKNILVSYNCNDMSLAKNKDEYEIYHPRFLNFIDTSND